jgi:hypothetical protein
VAKVTLRFFGRFVYVKSKSTTTIRVLAPWFPSRPFGPHQVHMSVRRNALVFRDLGTGEVLTTVRPVFKAVTDASLDDSEILVWDLSGMTISYGLSGAVSLTGDEVLDLKEIEQLAGRPAPELDEAAFRTDDTGTSNAIIDVTEGAGTAKRLSTIEGEYTFVTESDARDGDPDNDTEKEDKDGVKVKKKLADAVEFDVPLGGQGRLTLTLKDSKKTTVGTVTVVAGTMVSFSNLCTPLPRQHTYDLEFTRYYELLKGQRAPTQLIPREPATPSLGEGADCYLQTQIEGT